MLYFSRLATMKSRLNWVLLSSKSSSSSPSSMIHNHNQLILPLWGCRGAATSTTHHRTADPALHAGEPVGIDADEAWKAKAAQQEQDKQKPTIEVEGIKNQSVKPATQGIKLESSGVNPPIDPLTQQKRHYSQSTKSLSSSQGSSSSAPSLDDVSCVGMDGTPLPQEEEQSKEDEQKEYYKYHKPSPLAEIEIADTRKPVMQATDRGASSGYFGGERDVIGWKEEQLDTAEEALRRATLLWKEAAMRDDPDSPQAKALRRAMLEQASKSSSRSVNY